MLHCENSIFPNKIKFYIYFISFHFISNKRQQKLTSVQTIKIYPTNFKSNQQKRTYDGKSNKEE